MNNPSAHKSVRNQEQVEMRVCCSPEVELVVDSARGRLVHFACAALQAYATTRERLEMPSAGGVREPKRARQQKTADG